MPRFTLPRDNLTNQSQVAKATAIECEMEICQDLQRLDTAEMKRSLLGDGTRAKAAQGSKLRANKGLGVKHNKSCADGYSGVVRGLETPISHNSNEHKNGEFGIGSPNLGLNPQSVVGVPHGHSLNILRSSGDFKQAKKAISDALFRRIRMDYPREEECGFQRGGGSTYGESSKSEITPDS
nr:hypothetical protein CFP56_45156 [Quercus suber]